VSMRVRIIIALAAVVPSSACSGPDDAPGNLHLVLVQAPTHGAAGLPTSPVIVRVVDENDQPQVGVPVTWAVTAGGGSIQPGADTSGVDGLASAQWTLGFGAGENRLAISIYDDVALPVAVVGDAFRAEQVTVAYGQACGVSDGDLWCWRTSYGHRPPVRRLPQFEIVQAALNGGSDVCALDRAGATRCLSPEYGQPEEFQTVFGLPPLSSISAGKRYACGVSAIDATPWCWDVPDFFPRPPMQAQQVSPTLHLRSVSAGGGPGRFACGVAEDGAAWCWGDGSSGQLGNGTNQGSLEPVPVSGGLQYRRVSAGGTFACGIASTNEFYCWGSAQYGLGNGPSAVPQRIEGISAAAASANADAAGVLTAGGNAELWGMGYNSPRTDLRSDPQFRTIPVTALAAGVNPCVIASDRTVYCLYSDTGDGAFNWAPVPVPEPAGVSP
jgi:hypothetical protein